jgi:hypothetical protein
MPSPTLDVSPTVRPNAPYLREPPDGAVLSQPLPSQEWLFVWWADPDPCYTAIAIDGPGGRHLGDGHVESATVDYRYAYETTQNLPADAAGRWIWYVDVFCPTGSNRSGTRTFYFYLATPTPTPGP